MSENTLEHNSRKYRRTKILPSQRQLGSRRGPEEQALNRIDSSDTDRERGATITHKKEKGVNNPKFLGE